jgi:ubiquinone/menaquinone biosynthesis C-methylase UbiE
VVDQDCWSRWLLERRDAGDERQRAVTLEHLAGIRDLVLANAEPLRGATLLDVGTGEGLIGLEALGRVGPTGRVIFSDISEALLEQTRAAVRARNATDRASFVTTRAEDLAEIADDSVDVITARSVLIYVADKAQAFSAMHRVLRVGGRISIFEPINRLTSPESGERFWGYDVSSVVDLAAKVKAIFAQREDPSVVAAMMDFDDRDLARLAQAAGFERVHVECHIHLGPGSMMRSVSLQTLLDSSPNPFAPTVREAVEASLTKPEQRRFLDVLEQAIADDRCVRHSAVAYLAAGEAADRVAVC